nr:hypothetical protein HEP87_00915 [Streptomyces sp. S1D4-11]
MYTAEVERSAVPLPESLTALVAQLESEIETLAKSSPLAAVRAARRLEVIATQTAYWPAREARQDAHRPARRMGPARHLGPRGEGHPYRRQLGRLPLQRAEPHHCLSTYIEMASRLLEPTLLALAALAVRGRIKR